MASAVNHRALIWVTLCLLGLALTRCGGSRAPEPATGPGPTAGQQPEQSPAAPPEKIAGVPEYDPTSASRKDPEPPTLMNTTMTPAALRECSVDDLTVINALIRKASSAYVEAKYDEAIDLARRALARCKNENYMAHQLIGASSCFKKDARNARLSYARIPPDKKGLIEKVCQRAGIVLGP